MPAWEYKIIPAPTKGAKARGVKGADNRFAHALELLMNEMGAEGWEFQRAETLPSIERAGLTGTTTEWRNMMVFRRARVEATDDFEHELLPAPAPPVATEPDPSAAAASLRPRETPETPKTPVPSASATDEFEHRRASGSPARHSAPETDEKEPDSNARVEKAQNTAQDTRTIAVESLRQADQTSDHGPDDKPKTIHAGSSGFSDKKSKD